MLERIKGFNHSLHSNMKLFFKKTPSIKHQTREYKRLSLFRMVNILSIFLIIMIFGLTTWFVYTHIYQTIGKVQTLLLVQADPHFETINFKLYDDTRALWDQKHTTIPLDIFHDPFYNISTKDQIVTSTKNIIETEL